MSRRIPCVLMRGGTSKGVFLKGEDVPSDPSERDRLILAIFGSPDARQVNGLGGADPLTSKVAVVSRSTRADCDVDYLFGQVGIDRAEVAYANNCGNLSSAVGPFAVDEGWIAATTPEVTVRIFNVNSGKRILARFKTQGGKAVDSGDYRLDGVPGTGAPIRLTFCEPAGAATGKLLPTGNALDQVSLGGVRADVSIVDCGNLYTFVSASDLGLNGAESPADIEARKDVMQRVDQLRVEVSGRLAEIGAVSAEKAKALRGSLKVALVAPAGAGVTGEVDVVSRILNPGKVHKSFAVTGAIAVAGAAAVPGSVVGQLFTANTTPGTRRVCIGHPQGKIETEIEFRQDAGNPVITGATIFRTARRIMDGFVYV